VDLSWAAGIYAVTHDVYFSSDFNDVNDRLIDPCNTGATNSYDPPGNGLEFSTTYYWRVDECNASGGPQWPGDLWSFTTSDHITVDDMDSYVDNDTLKAVWTVGHLAGNGAEIFVSFGKTDANLVRDGNSMMFTYRNYNYVGDYVYVGSEATVSIADLPIGPDWTTGGIKAWALYFYGAPGNGQTGQYYAPYHITNDQMYVALEDGVGGVGIVKWPDMNAIKEASWHEWNIELADPCLADVNLADVANVYIGFGGQKTGQSDYGAGWQSGDFDTVWFDDIRLYPPRCVPEFAPANGSFGHFNHKGRAATG